MNHITVRNINTIVLLSLLCCYWIILILPFGFGHRDEIALLTAYIPPTTYAGRFFPLGHQEFNLLSLELFGGNIGYLYIIPFLQYCVSILILCFIVSPLSIIIRNIAIVAISIASFSIPFSNLIVPERSALFFILVAFGFLLVFLRSESKLALFCAFLAANVAMYYKEPVFLVWLAFLFSSVVFYCLYGPRSVYPISRGQFFSILFFTFVSISFFLLLYFFISFSAIGEDAVYGGGVDFSSLLARLFQSSPVLYLIALNILISAVSINSARNYKIFENLIIVSLNVGSLFYSLSIILLSFSFNSYYFSIPIMLSILSLALFTQIYFVDFLKGLSPSGGRDKANLSFWITWRGYFNIIPRAACLTLAVFFLWNVVVGVSVQVFYEAKRAHSYRVEYKFISEILSQNGNFENLFYRPVSSPYNDYATSVLLIFVTRTGISNKFNIYSEAGCYPWFESYNNGLINCFQIDGDMLDYDLLIFEGDVPEFSGSESYIMHSISIDNERHPYQSLNIAVREYFDRTDVLNQTFSNELP